MPECLRPQQTWRMAGFAGAMAACLWLGACESPKPKAAKSVVEEPKKPIPSPALAAARVDLAKARLTEGFQDEALLHSVAALDADPSFAEARDLVVSILASTRWQIVESSIRFPLPIDRIEVAAPSSLWISLTGEVNTVVRWNLESGRMEAVMFPIKAEGTRAMAFDSQHRHAVIERGGITLLCDAQSLKPIRDLGLLPDNISPSSNIAFSADGLLLAHPEQVSGNDRSVVWRIRDSNTGEILRSSDPANGPGSRPVAAHLDRQSLKVLRADGSILNMPVSPIEAVTLSPSKEPIEVLHAVFSPTGGAADVLASQGPHGTPARRVLAFDQPLATQEPMSLLATFSWSRHPNVWNGLMRGSPGFSVSDRIVHMSSDSRSPIRLDHEATALALDGDRILTGDKAGNLAIHRSLPALGSGAGNSSKTGTNPNAVGAIVALSEFLTGIRLDETRREPQTIDTESRLMRLKACDFDALAGSFPDMDFEPLRVAAAGFQPLAIPDDAMSPLTARLARAGNPNVQPDLEKVFENAEDEPVLAAIKQAGARDAKAAKALQLALDSTHANWIRGCLEQAKDLPPLLQKLATSRIAWIENRKAEAIAGWPDVFPDLNQVRLREDWDGWEQADFNPAMEKLKLCIREVLDALVVPPESTPEQRMAVFERLTNQETVVAVGKPRYARACLDAALAFSKFKDEKETTFQLATIARNLGEAAAPCLRAEAMALTAMGDYQQARERWISLITEHPIAEQEPGDYAEAAYTSFENADPQQAMNILTTGMHRFPNDANFALRSGWVSLLTGNAERAYRFLLTGKQIGYPEEKLENATALLAIAAVQTGANEDAEVFYQDLIALDPAWQDAATIETLDWPEELKASLRQLAW